jgi:hypothetical protein
MAIDTKFTGKTHTHDPVSLALKTKKQALRLTAMLDMLEEHVDRANHIGMIMVALTERGARIVLCRGCLEVARQEMLDAAGIMEDLIKHPADGE